jgi:hypothetical protein
MEAPEDRDYDTNADQEWKDDANPQGSSHTSCDQEVEKFEGTRQVKKPCVVVTPEEK